MRQTIFIASNFRASRDSNPLPAEILRDYLVHDGYRVIHAQGHANRYVRVINMLLHLIVNVKQAELVLIDVFSGRAFLWAEISGHLCRIWKKPYICVLHGGNIPEFGRKNLRRVRSLLKSAAAVISPSSYLMESLKPFGIDIAVIPNPILLDQFTFRKRSQLQPALFWFRAFHPFYNPEMAVKVLACIRQTCPEASLTMAGPDKGSMDVCKRLAKELGVSDHIRFPGRITKADINRIAQEHDIFINTSNVDNAPVSIIEAMALGMPVVSTNAGGIPFLINQEEDGVLVKTGDDQGMSRRILDLLSDNLLSQRLSENGRKKAESQDVSIVFPQWVSMFAAVMNREKDRQ